MPLRYLPFLTILLACHSSPTPLSQSDQAKISESIRQTLHNYHHDIRTSGLTAEFNYLDHSPDFFWVPPGYTTAISYDSVAAVLNRNAPLYQSIDNSFDTLRIVPLNHELATYTGRLRSTMTDTSGHVMTYSLIETGIMIKRPDGWKLLNGQTSALK